MDNTKRIEPLLGKNKGVLFILIDAFRWDYITPMDTPTIYSMLPKSVYVEKLKSSSGFTQRTALFTGTLPDKNGFYTMYVRDPNTSPFKALRPFSWFLRQIKQGTLFYKITRKFINQLPKLTTQWAPPGHIPSEILHHISVIEDLKPIQDKGVLPFESVFDKMRECGIPFHYHMAPVSGDDESTFKALESEIQKGGQVYFVQFSDTDGLVHKHGVGSTMRHAVVRQVDERVKKLRSVMEGRFGNPWIIILGDHGMVDVKEYINVWEIAETCAKSNGLKHGKDYLMFLDSTLARFWFFSREARMVLEPCLRTRLAESGDWIDESYRRSHNIPDKAIWYGDMIWKADARVGIFPDYFHGLNDRYIGMHGFDNEDDTQKGTVVFFNNGLLTQTLIKEGSIEQVAESLCDLLDLGGLKEATGKSFIPRV